MQKSDLNISSAPLRQMQRLLGTLMRDPYRQPQLAAAVGLSCEQLRAMEWVSWQPGVLTIGMADDGALLPPRLYHPRDGAAIPLRAVRSERGLAQRGWMLAKNASHKTGYGTLNSILTAPGSDDFYALTAGHVLAAGARTVIGDDVSLEPGAGGSAVLAKLNNWMPYFPDDRPSTEIDAALATIDRQRLLALQASGLVHPTGCATLELNLRCVLRTRDSYYFAVPRTVVSCWLRANDGDGGGRDYLMENSVGYDLVDSTGNVNGERTQGGDSGAPLWNDAEQLVGMHLGVGPGGAQGAAIAMPIQAVLNWCGAQVLTRDAAPASPAVASVAPATATPAAKQTPVAPVSALPGSASQVADILARTIWAEARGEPDARAGMAAVANVVLNRVRRQTYWGRTIAEVCQKPYQFSCWNKNDVNLGQLLTVNTSNREFVIALELANAAVNNNPPADATRGATHYYARTMPQPPGWSLGHQPSAAIGNHLFFNDIK